MLESSLLTRFLEGHSPQLLSSEVPEHFWPALCRKIAEQDFASGGNFILSPAKRNAGRAQFIVYVLNEEGIRHDDPNAIYLIDHAWTFTAEKVREQLSSAPRLLDRMCDLMGVGEGSTEQKIELVNAYIWRFAQSYSLGGSLPVELKTPVWYVMDELGSCIEHSDEPNFRTIPFLNIPDQTMYTLMFPAKDVSYGEIVTRDYVDNFTEDHCTRAALLLPWRADDFESIDFAQDEPTVDYFLDGHIEETLPALSNLNGITHSAKLKVYSEYGLINEYLTSPHFELVSLETDADVVWKLSHFRSFKEFSEATPHKLINQFPYEYVLNIKDLLAAVCRRDTTRMHDTESLRTYPSWLPTTFNLKTELAKFVSYFRRRASLSLDNHWICKPFNLARSLDTHISDNLEFLVRLPLSGPKIAQKYIEDPVLFDRPDVGSVKFDIRYVILLRSVNPTSVYIYTNFFLRFANLPFAMENFEEYQRHFTVMNYDDDVKLYALKCAEFKAEWRRQYPNINWDDIQNDVFAMLRDVFVRATAKQPPLGVAHSPQSRALYAADLMLAWDRGNTKTDIQPKILEINWMPDCQRACEYYPDFYNDIFSSLFLDQPVDSCVKIL